MMKKVIGVIFFLFISVALSAQFTDSTHYHVRYGITGILNKTNERRSFVLNNMLTLGMSKEKATFNSSTAWIYGRQDGQLSNNDFSSAFNIDFLKNKQKVYYWGLASFVSSYSLNIRHQLQAGGGIGWNVVNKPALEIVISDGLLYEASRIKTADDITQSYQTVRNSLRIKHKWIINERVTFEGAHFWQPSLERFDDYIIRSQTSLGIKLRKWLSLTSMVTYNKVSRTDRENLLINFGLVAENYF